VLFPALKIADVAGPPDVPCPCLGRLQGRVIEPDREEHRRALGVGGEIPAEPALLLQGRLDLGLDPVAPDRRLREDEQQLVVDADGAVDLVAEAIPDLQVFGREPAAHPLALQVGVQPLGELLIAARVADEAGIELYGSPDQRAGVGDERVRDAGATQEGIGDVAAGSVECVDADD